MPAYIIVRIQAENPEHLKAYQARTPAIIEKFNGKFIARGGRIETLEGPEEKRRVVIIEFPDLESARAFFYSEEYQDARKLRLDVAEAEFIAVEGL